MRDSERRLKEREEEADELTRAAEAEAARVLNAADSGELNDDGPFGEMIQAAMPYLIKKFAPELAVMFEDSGEMTVSDLRDPAAIAAEAAAAVVTEAAE